ncbi:MAG: PD40 domain-containing protein [SAR324 cluster bacterium]|nr:PD40 domain-containing protein [SAR324 cluster bacterium]
MQRIKGIKSILCVVFLLVGIHGLGYAKEKVGQSEEIPSKLTLLQWHTLETDHFLVHYPEGLEELARLSAGYAEESHALLSPIMDWQPEEKVHVIVHDTKDQQDGYASNFPYPTLNIFPNAPDISGVVAEYESQDWLRALILHEYFHVLHLDTVEGYSKLVRTIFGRPGYAPNPLVSSLFLFLNSPNNFAPLWLWEGLAVYLETELTNSGRGRSTRSEMVLRMHALEDQLLQIDQIDFHKPGIPGEHSRYLYGGYFVDYLVDGAPRSAIRGINHNIATWLPYTGVYTIQHSDGTSLSGLYDRFFEHQKQEQQKRISILRTQPLTSPQSLYSEGYQQKGFALSPDETRVAFAEGSGDYGKRIRLWHKETGKFETLLEQDANSLVWHPNQNYLFFTATAPRGIYSYRDLFVYDFEKKQVHQLTHGARVGNMDLSPDGRQMVAVENGKGHQNLVLYHLTATENESLPFKAERGKLLTHFQYSRIAMPRWNGQGNQVVYSLTDRKGGTSLPILEVSSQKEILRITEGHLQSAPIWGPDDQSIVFSSDHSGVSNLYRFDLTTKVLKPVTHVLGGAFLPVLAQQSQRLYFQNYVSPGFELAYMPWDGKQVRSDPLPRIRSTWFFNRELAQELEQSKVPVIEFSSEPYNDRKNLASQFWFMYGEEEPDGYAWGAITAGEDPLANHTYFATLTKGKEKLYHQFSYTNDQWKPTFSFNSTLLPRRYPFGLGVPRLWETVHDMSATLSWKIEGALEIGGGWLYHYQEPFDDDDFVDKVNDQLMGEIAENTKVSVSEMEPLFDTTRRYFNSRSFVGKRQGISLFAAYSSFSHYPLSISEAKGYSFAVDLTYFPENSGTNPKIEVIDVDDFDDTLEAIKGDSEGLTAAQQETFLEQLHAQKTQLSNEHTLLSLNYTKFQALWMKHHVLQFNLSAGTSLGQNESQAFFVTGYHIPLRGYRTYTETAEWYTAYTLEWHMPLFHIFRGMGTLPFYYRQFHTSLFYDYGIFSGDYQNINVTVSDEIFYLRDALGLQTRRSAGIEFKLLTHLGYRYPVNLVLRLSNAVDINDVPGNTDVRPFWAELDYALTF